MHLGFFVVRQLLADRAFGTGMDLIADIGTG
jgi:hypothetical protein